MTMAIFLKNPHLFEGRVQCFLMQVLRFKEQCFLLNPEKKFRADPS